MYIIEYIYACSICLFVVKTRLLEIVIGIDEDIGMRKGGRKEGRKKKGGRRREEGGKNGGNNGGKNRIGFQNSCEKSTLLMHISF